MLQGAQTDGRTPGRFVSERTAPGSDVSLMGAFRPFDATAWASTEIHQMRAPGPFINSSHTTSRLRIKQALGALLLLESFLPPVVASDFVIDNPFQICVGNDDSI